MATTEDLDSKSCEHNWNQEPYCGNTTRKSCWPWETNRERSVKMKRGKTRGGEIVRIWEERKSKEKGENWELTVRLGDRGAKIVVSRGYRG